MSVRIEEEILIFDFVEIRKDQCHIEGRYQGDLSRQEIIFENGKKDIVFPLIYEDALGMYRFDAWLDLNGHKRFTYKIDDHIPDIRYGKFMPLSDIYRFMYHVSDGYILSRKDNGFVFEKDRFWKRFCHELIFLSELALRKTQRSDLHMAQLKAVFIRPLIELNQLFERKPVWLFRDRPDLADDNGLAMFSYMVKNHPEIKSVFVLSENSRDHDRVSKIGKVVDCFSGKYKLLYPLASYMISSAADEDVSDPFEGHSEPYKDMLVKVKQIFLQHGVTKDDVSSWLNRYNKNLYGFITSSQREKDSIVHGDYFYDEDHIWLTGMPRFDRLHEEGSRFITIMPTWRRYLLKKRNDTDSGWELNDDFYESSFFKEYQSLLNDKALLDAAEQYGYQIAFMPHPAMMNCAKDLIRDERAVLIKDLSYQKVYGNSALIVSDYSSAVFDFVYMRKPVLYFQFDEDEFFDSHIYGKGYFSYEKDGFGEVEYDKDRLVSRIIEYMKDGCHMKKMYADRADAFFAYEDRNSCRRVYEEIISREK